MKCMEVEEWMAAYVAGQSGRLREQAIAAHLLTCASCRAWHDDVQAAWGMWQESLADPALAAMPAISEPAPDLVTPVMQRLARPRPVPPALPLRHALIHYGVAASAAMIMFSTGLMDRYGEGMLNLHAGLTQLISLVSTILTGGAV